MQRLTRCTVVLSLLAFLGTLSAPRLLAQTSTVRCESRGTSQEQCPIPSNARVELTRPLSPVACREGLQLGRGHQLHLGQPRLPGGVRGDEHRLRAGPGQRERQSEPAPGLPERGGPPAGGLFLRPDLGRARVPARERRLRALVGRPDERALHGARQRPGARVHQQPRGHGGGGTTRVICESRRYGREECPIPAGASIRLVRQTGQDPCRLNDTYGQGAGYIWVAKGCRGEFEVVTVGGGGGAGSGRVVCASSMNTRRGSVRFPPARRRASSAR